MSRRRVLQAGKKAPLNKLRGSSGSHQKAIPDYVIVKLIGTGATDRKIVKKLGCDLEQVRAVRERAGV